MIITLVINHNLGYVYYQGNSYYLGNDYNPGYDFITWDMNDLADRVRFRSIARARPRAQSKHVAAAPGRQGSHLERRKN